MYKMLCGLIFTAVSDDVAIDEMILVSNTINTTTNNIADPKNDARNVLKNDFIKTILLGFKDTIFFKFAQNKSEYESTFFDSFRY